MIILKQDDTGIGLKATLSNENGPVDLTDADVLFFMNKETIYPHVTNAPNGEVMLEPYTKETGMYHCEFKVTFPDGRKESFPNDGYEQIKIIGGV